MIHNTDQRVGKGELVHGLAGWLRSRGVLRPNPRYTPRLNLLLILAPIVWRIVTRLITARKERVQLARGEDIPNRIRLTLDKPVAGKVPPRVR